jgi:hypothetical protein
MCNIIILNTTRTINKKKQQSINNVKKKVREESTRNNHVLFSFFSFRREENKTGEYNTKTQIIIIIQINIVFLFQLSEFVVDDNVDTSDTDCCN